MWIAAWAGFWLTVWLVFRRVERNVLLTCCTEFAWYDLWVGVYYDRGRRRIYFFPIPCFGWMYPRA